MLVGVVVFGVGMIALAQNQEGGPATRPAGSSDPDRMLKQLLTPARPTVRPLEPVPDAQAFDRTNRISAMAVGAKPEARPLIREGEIIAQRVGRLTRTAEGQAEFSFEADGQTLQDPPMVILPNLQLMRMENAIKNLGRDLRFRISGMVTEYNGRNYILIETVSVSSEPAVR
jgi:hypothetical protein